MFKLNKTSLEFLLTQVNIGTDYGQLVNALDPGGLREVAGTNNSLVGSTAGTPGPFTPGPYETLGATDTPFVRMSQVSYSSDPAVAAGYGELNGNPNIGGDVIDANPRTISLLVSDANVNTNPAAQSAVDNAAEAGAFVDANGVAHIPNAGVLGGGKFNDFLVGFGQFFDHGLDFVQKGANGTIMIPLAPGDPKYIAPELSPGVPNPAYVPGVSNIMFVSRANLANPDSDFTNGVLNAGVAPIYNNNTAMDIDQSQTYGSDANLNALLREYTDEGVVTGRVVAGHTTDGPALSTGLATWADIKANAERIGVHLVDTDISKIPMLRVSVIGNMEFTPTPNAAWTTDSVVVGPQAADDPFVRDGAGSVMFTDQPFLIDINPAADPNFHFDIDPGTGQEMVYAGGTDYDAALLDAHFIAGDGRINENYQVTAVHNVFHEEHNYQVNNIKTSVLAEATALGGQAGIDYINNWLADPALAVPASFDDVSWDGNKIFQAARLITESEYNHIAIDQFFGALYGALPEFVSYSSDINIGVTLEFAQSVYRLGHSMLTENITEVDLNTYDPNAVTNPSSLGTPAAGPGVTSDGSIIADGALNPLGFAANPAGITLGQILQVGDEIDEFIAPAIQNTLNGQLLDLAAIDIARGRDVGLPTLNQLRQQIYDGLLQYAPNTNGGALAPYQSWADFGDHLRNADSLVNLIAAYARDDEADYGVTGYGHLIADARAAFEDGTGSLDDIRAAAQAVLDDYSNGVAAAVQFMEGRPSYDSNTHTWTFTGENLGFWDVDLWIGGLSERPMFDAPLGTTFAYIMLDFAQKMQDGDRFYYLYRTPMGTDLGDEIIANQFGDLVARANGLEHLNGDVFIAADKYWFLDGSNWIKDQAPQLTNVDGDDNYDDYFSLATHTLNPTVVAATVGNASLESDSLASGSPGVTTSALGNYTTTAPADWTITGQGGLFAPVSGVSDTAGHDGSNVVWLRNGATLAQNTGITLSEGSIYSLTFNIGDRGDQPFGGGTARLVDASGNPLGTPVVLPTPGANGGWAAVTVTTTAITAAQAGGELRIEIQQDAANGSNQILVDNIAMTVTEPGAPASGGHNVIVGGLGDDYIIGGLGDDTLWGDEGNDFLQGSQGNDHIYGGDGDDFITDDENDDFIRGGAGNDIIFAGPGAIDTVFGDEGDDEIHGGDGIDEIIGGDGNDMLYGDGDTDVLFGDAGDDYVNGGDSVDEVWGGDGNDWLFGGVGDDHLVGQEGNDLLEGGVGPTANDGDRLIGGGGADFGVAAAAAPPDTGFDVASYEHVDIAITADLQTSNANGTGALLDTYSGIDGVVGSQLGDHLTGAGTDTTTDNGADNLLVGGAGDDVLTGLSGDDIIVGDAVAVHSDFTVDANFASTIANWKNTGEDRPDYGGATGLGYLLGDNGAAGTDTAVFSGNVIDYAFDDTSYGGYQAISVVGPDGSDVLIDIEKLQFDSGTVNVVPGTPGNDRGAQGAGTLVGGSGQDLILGYAGDDTLRGSGGADILNGGAGNDIVNGQGGNDTIVWNVGDGSDRVNGGGGNNDTFVLNGAGNYSIYAVSGTANSRIRSQVEGLYGTLNGNAEIAIVRDGVLIAQLWNVEELIVDTTNVSANDGNGGPNIGLNVSVTGDFSATSLNYSTITIRGGDGDDAVDISGLTSDHRIVFDGGAGNNHVIGNPRPQDVVESATYSSGTDLPPSQDDDDDDDDDGNDNNDNSDANDGGQDDQGSTDNTGTTDSQTPVDSTSTAGAVQLGTPAADVLLGAAGDDAVSGQDGDDVIIGGAGADSLSAGNGDDLIRGDDGDDVIFGGAGNDVAFGGNGQDLLFGDDGNDRLFGDDGDDTIEGGSGNDTVFAGEGDDLVLATQNDGDDVYWGEGGSDTLDYAAITADLSADLGNGLLESGSVTSAQSGGDTVYGFENFLGGSGNDTVVASNAANVMDGGSGNDTFVFQSVEAANGDAIKGFAPGDKIDLAGIDADANAAGHQSFVLFAGAFSSAGQVITTYAQQADGEHTLVQGNVTGGANVDFVIDLAGHHELTSADFNGVS